MKTTFFFKEKHDTTDINIRIGMNPLSTSIGEREKKAESRHILKSIKMSETQKVKHSLTVSKSPHNIQIC